MTFLPTSRSYSLASRTAWRPAAPSPAVLGAANQHSVLPHKPSAIPVTPGGGPLEREADTIAAHAAGAMHAAGAAPRSTASTTESFDAPPSAQEALASPGRALDRGTRSLMEPRLGADLSAVRIHTGPQAARAAEGVHARAYTVGQDIVFGAGKYDPHSREGRRLLAHELTHTVQQSGGAKATGVSKASPALQRDPVSQSKPAAQGTAVDTDTKKPKTDEVTVTVPPSLLTQYRLTPPSLLTPPQQPSLFSPGAYSLGSGSSSGLTLPAGLTKPTLPLPSQYTPSGSVPPVAQQGPSLTPSAGSGSSAPAVSPKAPDRLSFHDFGRLSIGARIGFPDLSQDVKPGDPPSALQESLKKGQVLNFMLTGQPPPEYSIDPGKLVGVLWGIFSTQIAPSAAAKLAAGMASKPKGGGPTYQLDATILFGSSGGKTGGGGGATLTVNF